MRRTTHLLLGAAVALPIAASLSPALAIGGLWWGTVGGGFPDWLDLRSDLRTSLRLRHRGVSHSVIMSAGIALMFGIALSVGAEQTWTLGSWSFEIPEDAVRPWFLCFLAGILSHLVSDAMTHSGIQPLLPFSRVRLRLLPRILRSRYDGYLDTLLRAGALIALGVGLTLYVVGR